VHEGFTHYSETLFTEYIYGRDGGDAYVQGIRRNIQNDKPIIGTYGLNKKGSGDMYYKGAAMLHTIRQIIGNDETFRQILRALNRDFYHSIVTSALVEQYITKKAGIDFSRVFDQYLRTTKVPEFQYRLLAGGNLEFKWENVVEGFDMPLRIYFGEQSVMLNPTNDVQIVQLQSGIDSIKIDLNYYVVSKNVAQ
jgi:hypothetical protein